MYHININGETYVKASEVADCLSELPWYRWSYEGMQSGAHINKEKIKTRNILRKMDCARYALKNTIKAFKTSEYDGAYKPYVRGIELNAFIEQLEELCKDDL